MEVDLVSVGNVTNISSRSASKLLQNATSLALPQTIPPSFCTKSPASPFTTPTIPLSPQSL